MEVILSLLGVFCLGYFFACGIYAGFGASFLVIWPVAGVLCLGAAFCLRMHRSSRWLWHLPHGVKIVLGCVLLAGALTFAVMEGLIVSQMFAKGEPELEYVLVLGAQVRGDHVSRALEDRLKTAKAYLDENPETKALLSGGQGPGENLTEAQAMYDWLVAHDVSADRLIMEDRSTSTWENMTFSKALIPEETGQVHIGIVTNNFHVYRGVMLAKRCGFTKACGIAAKSHSLMQLHFMVREGIALAKDMVKGMR